jgi:cytochrome c oxidase accessory protein FixG
VIDARPVEGSFRKLRWGANLVLIAILFAIPWIRIGSEPLVLLDIPNRQFHVFGLVIFPQELFFLWLILAGAALALFFFTALFGRVWCGWACPQTVFTDVFAGIARRIQGWKGKTRPAKVPAWRLVVTHAVWLLASLVIGFHLVGYFHSPYDLIAEAAKGHLYPTALSFHLVAAVLAYFDFVFLKQTFCKHLCPYARFQGVLFDKDTLVIGYDEGRGEPRGKAGRTEGDCVDCGLCVAVCPTGIDIRKGLQLECIACTQCIDACNGVMERLDRAENLIGYRSLVSLRGDRDVRILRPRVLAYGVLLLAVATSFTLLLGRRSPMDLFVERNRDSLYSRMDDGRVGNSFILHIQNRDRVDHSFRIRVDDPDFDLVAGVNPISVHAASSIETRVFVLADANDGLQTNTPLRFVLEREDGSERSIVRATNFLAPGGNLGGS